MTENNTLPLTEVVVFDGFDDLDAIAPLEILTAAGFPTRVVRPPGHAATVHSAHGLVMEVDAELGAGPRWCWSRAAAGWTPRPACAISARASCRRGSPRCTTPGRWWRRCAPGRCSWRAPACWPGARRSPTATLWTTWQAAGADVHREARVVDDGSVVTGGGPAAGLDLAIRLVARFAGEDAGREAASRLEHEPVGQVLVSVGTA